MLLKMTTGLSGPDFNLAPGDKHEFDDGEAERLVEAGFAERADADAAPAEKRKKGKANVVSTEGNAGAE
ncbi:hypothetical protein HFO09_07695 [Rhizobium laguerreae]|uniref:hypothetical protein n=1 Tax=Rhizobium laguerreae TaxID=1076926 RepID=UPI001C902D2C|nr:hypothetical protein [Rhizobium laguerreae]MBY3255574.1 hypothetical protein [Rhizobium laguerreae]MBY3282613.1 hypothetical protein [Rhizobium laguerreae]MBY3288967.1 hypothetical protein [Rhizobium laguerreae]MBY3386399.1 hypothetical protein [Rhizobium laguerreae]MBY3400482.1 hypothetical protein [Rhizobium laguerreae]